MILSCPEKPLNKPLNKNKKLRTKTTAENKDITKKPTDRKNFSKYSIFPKEGRKGRTKQRPWEMNRKQAAASPINNCIEYK